MHRTIFTTPGVSTLLRGFSLAWLKLAGWTVQGELPAEAHKSVFIAAPHTSNWDLPNTLFAAFALRLTPYWMGKASIFKFPFGGVMRWLGGIPVDRSKASNLVAASAAALRPSFGKRCQLSATSRGIPGPGTSVKARPALCHASRKVSLSP